MSGGSIASLRRLGILLALLGATGCLSEGLGPDAFRLALSPHTVTFDALEDTLRLHVARYDRNGTALRSRPVFFTSTAPLVASADSSGVIVSHSNGDAWVRGRDAGGAVDSVFVTVAQVMAAVVPSHDTLLLEALGEVQPVGILGVDRLGSPVTGVALQYTVTDTSVAAVNADGDVRAVANGWTTVTGIASTDSVTVTIHVAQRPTHVLVPDDTLRFVALGETQQVVGIAIDSLGSAIAAPVERVSVADSTVLRLLDSSTVRSLSNGVTAVGFEVAGLRQTLTVVVLQVPDTVVVTADSTESILSVPRDSLLPLSCRVLDRNGYDVTGTAAATAIVGGHWTGDRCGALAALQSGFDTLVVSAGSATSTIPVALAVRPVVSGLQPLALDSFPAGTGPWAPTLRGASDGSLELYVTAYRIDSSEPSGQGPGDLHRLISHDGGQSFQYDGVVLQHDSVPCSLNGSGIEHIDIVPRSDGVGWRMFYAGGSFTCYGWQVFSATSPDGRVWTKEGAVRLCNGSSASPDSVAPGPWPVGEGIVAERLPAGGWRILTGGYEHTIPSADKFQIVEWTSPDQLNWTLAGPILTTDQLPPAGQRSVYGETIREVTPGLWRMVFTADDLNVVGGSSRLWSALSVDGVHWQFEGELIGGPGQDFLYATMVGNRLVTVNGVGLASRRLYTATVAMP